MGRIKRSRKFIFLGAGALVVSLLVLAFASPFAGSRAADSQIPISKVLADARAGKISRITVQGGSDRITVYYRSAITGPAASAKDAAGQTATAIKEDGTSIRETLDAE